MGWDRNLAGCKNLYTHPIPSVASCHWMKQTMFKILQHYWTGIAVYDRCQQPSLRSQWQAFKDEISEFLEKPSLEEIWDILHSGGRVVWKLTGIPLQLLAWPTVRKHGLRFAEQGCIRSRRNCNGNCCLDTPLAKDREINKEDAGQVV